MASVWQTVFSHQNLKSYAEAAREINSHYRVLFLDGYDSIVVPSRGAYPILDLAQTLWELEIRSHKDFDARWAAKSEQLSSPIHRELTLPFSADPDTTCQTSSAIRLFWTKVLAAIVRRNNTSPYLQTYRCIVEQLVKGYWPSYVNPRNAPSENFIFVDTVVSGRAVCEIFDAFEREGLDKCFFLLIVDKQGQALKPEYRRRIDEMVSLGRCETIHVTSLFTEDRGPAVSGVWSTVYPGVMRKLQKKFPWAKDAYGAGSFYWKVRDDSSEYPPSKYNPGRNMPVTAMFGRIRTLMFSVLKNEEEIATLRREGRTTDQVQARISQHSNFYQYQLLEVEKALSKYKTFRASTTELLAKPRVKVIHPNASTTVSRSHLVRVNLPYKEESAFFKILVDNYLDSTIDVFSDTYGYEPTE
ncbi:hypothetical protein IFR08_09695 [Pseudomonas fluorescens]|uniref:hypothetical protein n=1 Tax=Pseudomonas fluorescens TaxID=294 RepID=UPI00123FCF3A|nr:hypothetical protein [Pseudomonas fluorescens]MBD8099122.1 hypothetical protein [Pseudomonas fluorescens]MBD8774041.1 hypothetical protein [Pseudomonas fluorescens]MBD8780929.1 hypothetical protein [Pseudomonas fluorescens]MBD8796806.1 hypothetical protein [Pseudomonas fluorescens]